MSEEGRLFRTQTRLTEAQVKSLKRLASQRHISMAELIREGVDRTIAAKEELLTINYAGKPRNTTSPPS